MSSRFHFPGFTNAFEVAPWSDSEVRRLSSNIVRAVSRFNRNLQRAAVLTYELLTGRF